MVATNFNLKTYKIFSQFCILLFIFSIFLLPNLTTVSAQEEILDNFPPVSNPKLDEKKHNLLNSVDVMEEVYFIGDDSYDPDPWDNLSFLWSFGDGGRSIEISPIHIYNKVGEYIVSLTVNDTNSSDTSSFKIRVISQGSHKPIPVIKSTVKKDENSNNYADTFEPIFFNGTDSFDPDGFPLTFDWDFGNGKTSTGENVVYEYPEDGTYIVILTVTDIEALQSKSSIEIVIGSGQKPDSDGNAAENNSDAEYLGYLILGFIIVVIILLLILWLYLNHARNRVMKQVKISSLGISQDKIPTTRSDGPPIPEFARKRTKERDNLVRQARLERLTTQQKTVKKDILRQRLASERKKVDSDMKKELEDMGIEL